MQSTSTWIYRAAALSLVAAAAAASGCTQLGLGELGATMCPEIGRPGDVLGARLSADVRANAKIVTFVQAAKDMAAVSAAVEAEVAATCRRMGADLGIPPMQMRARQGTGGDATGACEPVTATIDQILGQGMQLQITVTPPSCQADVQAEARCSGTCDVQVDPGQIVAQCEPGRLSGYCQGRCTGRCEGRCMGQCRGQCSAYDAQGRCVGQCAGECDGGCDATCHARCEGNWQAPRCEGSVRPPSVDAECQASCKAHADVRASCTPVGVNVWGTANTDMALRLGHTLQANLPALLHAELALGRRLLQDAQVVVKVGAQIPNVVGQAGAQALACAGAATDAAASASLRLQVSVRASANITGRVGATSGQ
ncbi:hypothetical protein [Chondromyces crocatus]|uniref:Keratin associated protein n=1 Tax=Chondromyces crocatus TaxID=52 RepID=A0A0K1EJN3_CHOCO|nr:hypothetical protein [Chondromyces crocatus]AKT40902.1 uncharacterized protein CMC5_050590 [Chondromyces crocatus]